MTTTPLSALPLPPSAPSPALSIPSPSSSLFSLSRPSPSSSSPSWRPSPLLSGRRRSELRKPGEESEKRDGRSRHATDRDDAAAGTGRGLTDRRATTHSPGGRIDSFLQSSALAVAAAADGFSATVFISPSEE